MAQPGAVVLPQARLDLDELRLAAAEVVRQSLVEAIDLFLAAAVLLHQAGVLDGDRRDVGQLASQLHRFAVEGGAPVSVVDVDGADDPALLAERHRQDRAQAQRGDRLGGAEPLVEGGVDGELDLAAACGALGDRAARPPFLAGQRLLADVAGDDDLEPIAPPGRVEQEEAALGRGELDGRVDDVVEQRLEPELGVEPAAERQETPEVAGRLDRAGGGRGRSAAHLALERRQPLGIGIGAEIGAVRLRRVGGDAVQLGARAGGQLGGPVGVSLGAGQARRKRLGAPGELETAGRPAAFGGLGQLVGQARLGATAGQRDPRPREAQAVAILVGDVGAVPGGRRQLLARAGPPRVGQRLGQRDAREQPRAHQPRLAGDGEGAAVGCLGAGAIPLAARHVAVEDVRPGLHLRHVAGGGAGQRLVGGAARGGDGAERHQRVAAVVQRGRQLGDVAECREIAARPVERDHGEPVAPALGVGGGLVEIADGGRVDVAGRPRLGAGLRVEQRGGRHVAAHLRRHAANREGAADPRAIGGRARAGLERGELDLGAGVVAEVEAGQPGRLEAHRARRRHRAGGGRRRGWIAGDLGRLAVAGPRDEEPRRHRRRLVVVRVLLAQSAQRRLGGVELPHHLLRAGQRQVGAPLDRLVARAGRPLCGGDRVGVAADRGGALAPDRVREAGEIGRCRGCGALGPGERLVAAAAGGGLLGRVERRARGPLGRAGHRQVAGARRRIGGLFLAPAQRGAVERAAARGRDRLVDRGGVDRSGQEEVVAVELGEAARRQLGRGRVDLSGGDIQGRRNAGDRRARPEHRGALEHRGELLRQRGGAPADQSRQAFLAGPVEQLAGGHLVRPGGPLELRGGAHDIDREPGETAGGAGELARPDLAHRAAEHRGGQLGDGARVERRDGEIERAIAGVGIGRLALVDPGDHERPRAREILVVRRQARDGAGDRIDSLDGDHLRRVGDAIERAGGERRRRGERADLPERREDAVGAAPHEGQGGEVSGRRRHLVATHRLGDERGSTRAGRSAQAHQTRPCLAARGAGQRTRETREHLVAADQSRRQQHARVGAGDRARRQRRGLAHARQVIEDDQRRRRALGRVRRGHLREQRRELARQPGGRRRRRAQRGLPPRRGVEERRAERVEIRAAVGGAAERLGRHVDRRAARGALAGRGGQPEIDERRAAAAVDN